MKCLPCPINPGVWTPPPVIEASSPKVIPTGVTLANSLLTTTNPFASGIIPQIHSKHPQEVIGSSSIEYNVTDSTAPWDIWFTVSFTEFHTPVLSSKHSPFSIGWQGPVGSSSLVALASNQLTAPQRPSLSGVTTQMIDISYKNRKCQHFHQLMKLIFHL